MSTEILVTVEQGASLAVVRDQSEVALVLRARAGDHDAFGELVDLRLNATFRSVMAILGNESDARDVTQTIFVQAWTNLPSLRDPALFPARFGRIVVNAARTALRGRRRRSVREIQASGLPDDRVVMPADEPTHEERTADLDRLERALERISAAERTVLWLHHYAGLSLADIGSRFRGSIRDSEIEAIHSTQSAGTRTAGGRPMNDPRIRDDMIVEAFDRRGRRATPVGLRGPILEATAATRQRRGQWGYRNGGASLRLLAAAALVTVGLAAGTVFVGSPLVADEPSTAPVAEEPSTAPVAMQPARVPDGEGSTRVEFYRTFEYQADSTIPLKTNDTRPSGRGALIAFTFGDIPYPTAKDGTVAPDAKGVTVSSAQDAWVHECARDRMKKIREEPSLFLFDLRSFAGVGLGESELITFDGRPARSVALDPAANLCEVADFHPRNVIHGILQEPVRLTVPSRLIVSEVDGETMVIQVWAGTEAGLQDWLPTSAGFVDSIHFTGGDSPAP